MKKAFVLSLFFLNAAAIRADVDVLLNQAGSDIEFTSPFKEKKELKLDNPFIIQFYSAWKALGPLTPESQQWFELVMNREYQKALIELPTVKEEKLTPLKKAAELYLLHQLGHYQTFFNRWTDLASTTPFLQTELGLTLDQVAGPQSSERLFAQGFFISPALKKQLAMIESSSSPINLSLQALNALRSGKKAIEWIGRLPETHPLRLFLAETALLHYAKEGKIGASGKLIKTVVEPLLAKSSNTEEIALHFITLARLLYQGGAMAQAKKYYDLIPPSSSYYLKAKTESLWIHLKEKDFARTKGELATLELNIFNDQFYPEAYVVSAMANTLLCQFTLSKAAIDRFIEVNRKWARTIESNLRSPEKAPLESNFFTSNLTRAKASLLQEKAALEKEKLGDGYLAPLSADLASIEHSLQNETLLQWKNRKILLESALYKMKFAKIELLSRMRQVALNLKWEGDQVSHYSAAVARGNQMSFPQEGPLWSDELFHLSASVKNKCMRGELK